MPARPLSHSWAVGLGGCCLVGKLCLTLCDPMDCSLASSSVHGIFQARILEWLPFPSPGDLSNSGIEPASLALASRFSTTEPPGKPGLRPHRQTQSCSQQLLWHHSSFPSEYKVSSYLYPGAFTGFNSIWDSHFPLWVIKFCLLLFDLLRRKKVSHQPEKTTFPLPTWM